MNPWRVISLLLLSLLFSCEPEKESEGFLAPEIVSAEAKVKGSSVSLECTLSSPRAETCGFVFWAEGEEKKTVISELSTTSFSSTIAGLIPGKEYEWYAFARAGGSEIRSQTSTFTFPKPVTPVPGPTEEPVGINIPDPYFKRYLLENFDVNGDGALSEDEALIIRKIDVVTDKISSMKGIEHFKNLDSLLCRGAAVSEYDDVGHPGLLDSLDVSSNRKLRYLACDKNMLCSLDISDNPFLEEILCSYNFSNTPLIHTIECGGNHITSIDVSKCPRLGTLNVGDLRIKELDLSGNPMLGWLGTYGTDISELDLSHNSNLELLNCQNSPIKELELSPCVKLHELKCWDCQLEDLNVSMLPKLETLECSPMTGTSGTNILKRRYVSEDQVIQGVTVNRSTKNIPEDTQIVPIKEGTIFIPDQYFRRYILDNFDLDSDGFLSEEEGLKITRIEVTSDLISSISGIEYFKNLTYLSCSGAPEGSYRDGSHPGLLEAIDVRSNTKLRSLKCDGNMVRELKLGDKPMLEEIFCNNNLIKSIDFSGAPKLGSINVAFNELTELDLSTNTRLWSLNCIENNISLCSLPGSLEQLACWDNPLGRIDVSGMPNLVDLACANTGLTELDVTHNPKLLRLAFNDNAIRHIDLSGNPLLEELSCWNCALGSLSLSNNPRLNMVICWGNLITSLDVSRNPSLGSRPEEKDYGLHCSPMEDEKGNNLLETLFVAENQFIPGVTPDRDDAMVPGGTDIQTLRQGMIPIKDKGFKAYLVANFDIDRDGEISYSEAETITGISMDSEDWGVESLQGIEYMPNLNHLYCAGKWYDDGITCGPLGTLRWVDVSNNPKLVSLNLSHNEHLGETIHSIDLSNNPELEGISLSYSNMDYPEISHLTKLKYFEARGCYGKVPVFSGFKKLEYLELRDSRDDKEFDVDVSGCPDLEELRINYTSGNLSDLTLNSKLRHLELDDCPAHSGMIETLVPRLPLLEYLSIGGNRITNLDLSGNPRLKYLNVGGNNSLGRLDISDNPELEYLCCDITGLSSLDLSHNPKLKELRCWSNDFAALDLAANKELKYLYCDDNKLTKLPLEANTKLEYINCSGNKLTTLDLSKLTKLACLDCGGNLITELDVSSNSELGTGMWDGRRVGLYCSPMNDAMGNNVLQTVLVSSNQSLPGVTINRDESHVPAGAKIIFK